MVTQLGTTTPTTVGMLGCKKLLKTSFFFLKLLHVCNERGAKIDQCYMKHGATTFKGRQQLLVSLLFTVAVFC